MNPRRPARGRTIDDRQLDLFLTDYFKPESAPAGLTRSVVRHARAMEEAMQQITQNLTIEATDRGVTLVSPHMGKAAGAARREAAGEDAKARRLAARARRELVEYLRGERAFFSVPVDLSGLPEFQRRVLETALAIPFGEVRSYSWIAKHIGKPRAVRAVGTALGRNPVPFIVPCHRVLRSDGSLGGYGFGLPMKRQLLDLERTTPVLEGCSSTHIVCRVGCDRGQKMRPDHRVVFASVADARSAGYRPCKVCKPAAA